MDHTTSKFRGSFLRGAAALGTSVVLAGAPWTPTPTASALDTPSPAATATLGTTLAQDEFNRTGTTLGSAPTGGRWATASPTGLLELRGGAAWWSGFAAGQTTHAWLPAVSSLDQQVSASFAFGLISRADYGMSHRTMVRQVNAGSRATGYRTAAQVLSNGKVSLGLSRVRNGAVTPLAGLAQAATLSSNKVLNVQTRVLGTSPVHLVARAWVSGTPTPDWQLSYTDAGTARISSPGSVGMNAYRAPTGAGRTVTLARFNARELLPRSRHLVGPRHPARPRRCGGFATSGREPH